MNRLLYPDSRADGQQAIFRFCPLICTTSALTLEKLEVAAARRR